jgi:nicotinic acid mononucleotide adenylyltransferase
MATALPDLKARFATGHASAAKTTSIFLIDAPTANVSATAIRQRLADGSNVDGLVPAAVAQHIEQHRLYRVFAVDRHRERSH